MPVSPDALEHLVRDMYWPGVVWALSQAASLLGDEARARALYPGVAPFAGQLLIDPAGAFLGCTDHYLALLAEASNRPDEAGRHRADAADVYARIGANWWRGSILHE